MFRTKVNTQQLHNNMRHSNYIICIQNKCNKPIQASEVEYTGYYHTQISCSYEELVC